MFDAKQAFKTIEGEWTLGELRIKLKDLRLQNLKVLGADIGAPELLDMARRQNWLEESSGKFTIQVK